MLSLEQKKYAKTYLDFKSKIYISPLGIKNHPFISKPNQVNSIVKIISCSNIKQVKRIDKIISFLIEFADLNQNLKIHWSHIGFGDLKILNNQIERASKRKNLLISFLGTKTPNEIFEIYRNNRFDFFLNYSDHEGMPVSIMEAMSFGLPIVATNVGSTSTLTHGLDLIIFDKDIEINELIKKIKNNLKYFKNSSFRRDIKENCLLKFNEEINYKKHFSFFFK